MHEFVDIKPTFPWRWFWILSNQALDRQDILIHNKEVCCIHKRPKFPRESIFVYFFISIFQKIVSFEVSASEWNILQGGGRKFKKSLVEALFPDAQKTFLRAFSGQADHWLILQVCPFLLCEKIWYEVEWSLRKQEFGFSVFPLDSGKKCSACDKHCCTQFMLLFFNSL